MTKMRPYVKFPSPTLLQKAAATNPNMIPWRVPQLCMSYKWPAVLPTGAKIGIVELGGGWSWDDMGRFFGSLGQPTPKIGDFSVDAGVMNPGFTGNNADLEVALDIQVAACSYFVATGAPATIRVYWANNDVGGIARAIARAAADGCDVFSCSWGADESAWGNTAGLALDVTAMNAVATGMVIFAASGDNDSSDGGPGAANVDLPASAPHVLGCGGTRRPHNSSHTNPEGVWNDDPGKSMGTGTGGGFSMLFPATGWQAGAPTNSFRMVPDVTANAAPVTGYYITVGGEDIVVGGTSAVAPLYAGLFAALGLKLGFVSPLLWQHQEAFSDIVKGNNGAFKATVGPDPCSGMGSPHGLALANVFKG